MSEVATSTNSRIDNDIIFECPECTKSFAIDHRGAGLVMACPGCTEMVQVPEPNAPLDPKTAVYEVEINELYTNVKELTERRNHLEHNRAENLKYMKTISENMLIIQAALDRINTVISEANLENG